MGVIETGLLAGFTASEISEVDAVAATFTARLCTSYLPRSGAGSRSSGSASTTTSDRWRSRGRKLHSPDARDDRRGRSVVGNAGVDLDL
jgi:hypothetical protein